MIRSGRVDFGSTIAPRWIPQRRSTWRDCGRSVGERFDRGIVEISPVRQRAPCLDRDAQPLAALDQRAAVLERAQLDLVDRRRRFGGGVDPVSSRASKLLTPIARVRPRSSARSIPGHAQLAPALRVVDEVEVERIEAEPLQAALGLGDGVAPARIELGGHEDLVARDPALAAARGRRWPRCRRPARCRRVGSRPRALRRPPAPSRGRRGSARYRSRAGQSRPSWRAPARSAGAHAATRVRWRASTRPCARRPRATG